MTDGISHLSTRRVDYDQVAHLYDEPERDKTADPDLAALVHQITSPRPAKVRILDMGCGTGKQLAANHAAFPAVEQVGLDLFGGMLREARTRCPSVSWVQGDSARPPFQESSFDYITNQFSYSHVLEKQRLILETYRILKSGGRFVLTHIDPWQMPDWILYRYFPTARDRDWQDFIPTQRLVRMMGKAGFRKIQVNRRIQLEKVSLPEFHAYASQRHRASQLMAISDSDYEKGLKRLAVDLDNLQGHQQVESKICFLSIIGEKE